MTPQELATRFNAACDALHRALEPIGRERRDSEWPFYALRKTSQKLRDAPEFDFPAALDFVIHELYRYPFRSDTLTVRVARIALSVAFRDYSSLRTDDFPFARAAVFRLDDPGIPMPETLTPPRRSPSGVDGVRALEFAFTWMKPSARLAGLEFHIDRVPVLIPEVDAGTAPVVLRLAAPHGEWIDIRQIGGTLYRPLLSVGSWAPIGVDDFIQAIGSGEAWRDRPGDLPRLRRSGVNADTGFEPSFGSLCHLEDAGAFKTPSTRNEKLARQEAAEKAIEQCSRLVIAGEGVWTPTPAPRVSLMRLSGNEAGRGCVLAWKAGALCSLAPQETIVIPSLDYLNAGFDCPGDDPVVWSPIACEGILRRAMERACLTRISQRPLAVLPDGGPLPPPKGRDLLYIAGAIRDAIEAIRRDSAHEPHVVLLSEPMRIASDALVLDCRQSHTNVSSAAVVSEKARSFGVAYRSLPQHRLSPNSFGSEALSLSSCAIRYVIALADALVEAFSAADDLGDAEAMSTAFR